MWAAQEGHTKVAEFLLEKGAQVDSLDEVHYYCITVQYMLYIDSSTEIYIE